MQGQICFVCGEARRPCGRDLLVTLLVSQLIKKFPAFYYHVYKSLTLVLVLNKHVAIICAWKWICHF
jgi:hypothetical protein